MSCGPDEGVMEHSASVLSLPNPHPQSDHVVSDKSRLGDLLQDTWPALLKTVQVTKQGRTEKCHRAEEPKEDMMTKYIQCGIQDGSVW